jgi:hypothetical protein
MKSKRQPVMIDAQVYERLKAYSEATGIAIARVVAGGLPDWLEALKKESAK